MKITRMGGLAAMAAAATLVLSACGSDDPADAGNASGSPAAAESSVEEPATSADAGSSADGPHASEPDTSGADAAGSSAGDQDDAGSASAGSASAGSASAGSASVGSGEAATFEGAGFTCVTGTLRSAGSTAQGKVMQAWIDAYNDRCGAQINDYGGGGSGKGVSDFIADQTDFSGSDSALSAEEHTLAQDRCAGNPAIDLPMVTGPIAVAYNVEGLDEVTLTPEILAGIFNDEIRMWDDPAIAAVNPDAQLPATSIQSVHRSEDSGTTDNFVRYLTANSDWPYEGGKAWQADGGTGAQGSDGVAKAIAGTDGSIGYIEWGFATANQLNIAKIDNGGGPVELTAETAGKAVAAAEVVGTGKDLSLELDYATKAEGAYPVILVTYEIVCAAGNGDTAELLKNFLGFAATDGQDMLVDLGAAPLPADIQAKVIDAVADLS